MRSLARPFQVVVRDYKRNVGEWLEARRNYITASDAAAFCGKNPYKSRKRAIADKITEPPFHKNQRMILGSHLEDGIAKAWREIKGTPCRPCTALLASTRYPWMAATPDLLARIPFLGFGAVDIKYSQKIDRDGRVPEYYRIQVEHQMAVLDVQAGGLVSLWGATFTEEYYVWDQARIDWIVECTRTAWEEIQKERVKLYGQR